MKKWNAPEVAELNINETANGLFNIEWETPFSIVGNDKRPTPDPNPNPDPTPSTPDDHS